MTVTGSNITSRRPIIWRPRNSFFNRAADIFTKVVELQEAGVEITPNDALIHQCGQCLQEALELGHMVHHRSGDEGLDEL